MEQWKESFVIVNIGKEGGTVVYISCSYDWLFLSPSFFLSPCQKIIVVKGFLFTQDMILRSPQALCIYVFQNLILWLWHMTVWMGNYEIEVYGSSLWIHEYHIEQNKAKGPLYLTFSHDFFLNLQKIAKQKYLQKSSTAETDKLKEPGSKFSTHSENRLEFQ